MSFKIERWHKIAAFLIIYDFFSVTVSYYLALWLRFDLKRSEIPSEYFYIYHSTIFSYAAFCILVFMVLKLYKSIWSVASYSELERVIVASLSTSIVYVLLASFTLGRMPISYYLVGGMLQFFAVLSVRFAYRFGKLLKKSLTAPEPSGRILLIGCGEAGKMLLKDINRSSYMDERVYAIIDDDSNKRGRTVEGVTVVGGRDAILETVKKYNINHIYVAIPSIDSRNKRDILSICKETDCMIKIVPELSVMIDAEVKVSAMKNVAVEDLLGRDPIKTDLKEVFDQIKGKRVLVTGGGGSIGSELCRQIASHEPEALIIFDVYENNAYSIQLELRDRYPELNLITLIGSVRDSRRMEDVFENYKPQIVYHAAAHKHVPLMEDSPCEAIKNNAIGTYKTALAALVHGAERFVLISTDKAVNPTNIMGASKRLCEMIIQSFDAKVKEGRVEDIPVLYTHYTKGGRYEMKTEYIEKTTEFKTEFVAVRFGNVLGSNGSVIPLFKKQIEKGGPVTVTHPDIIRYFMTIPEAVSLVLQAGNYARGGEIFVLDMGEPVKIVDLARNLIKLSGFKPDVDIKIDYTGLRPGEKLFEEKLMAEEGLKRTNNELIHIGCPIPFDTDEFLKEISSLMDYAYGNNEDGIRQHVQELVKTYHPA